MNNTNLALQADIRPLERQDIAEATAVMKRAFDDDSRRHLNQETGGPPGYDTGEFLRKNGFNRAARSFKAVVDGLIAGVIIVFLGKDGNHYLDCMFTDPDRQRKGIGRALFGYVEQTFPGSSWKLDTPIFAKSNHKFYEQKCGFKKIGEQAAEDGMPCVIYAKEY
ncbi:MAG: Acetyltransferase (GNAT) family protein [Spirochaetes bacterium ADurb.Bin215]|jgi:predicted N-acetyltransferase YhbS|nr:MAG: Acetyltransferase (GNAT) family protein [Spirochaetes bacterium ADurb.Bin215]